MIDNLYNTKGDPGRLGLTGSPGRLGLTGSPGPKGREGNPGQDGTYITINITLFLYTGICMHSFVYTATYIINV